MCASGCKGYCLQPQGTTSVFSLTWLCARLPLFDKPCHLKISSPSMFLRYVKHEGSMTGSQILPQPAEDPVNVRQQGVVSFYLYIYILEYATDMNTHMTHGSWDVFFASCSWFLCMRRSGARWMASSAIGACFFDGQISGIARFQLVREGSGNSAQAPLLLGLAPVCSSFSCAHQPIILLPQ